MTTIVFEDVWKEYDARIVLERVNLSLADHEFLVIIGPSGVGKTTLLRMLLSQEQPSRGRILIDGEPIAPEPTADRGVVFQRYSVFPHLTVLANVMRGPQWVASPFLGRLFGARRRALEAEAMALLERVGLAEHAAKYPQQLSGGMQQRLALAQALIMKPKVLLLDEPFGALDALVRKELRRWLRELHDRTGHTTLFVTHDQEEALELADRVVVMGKGRIEQVGTPDDVYDRPATATVFGFMGESSRIEVAVKDGIALAGDTAIAAATLPVPDGPGLVYVRPHDVSLGLPGTPGLKGEVRGFRRHGAIRRVEVSVGNALFEADIAPTVRVPVGEKVAVRLDRARLFASGGPGVDCRAPPPQQTGDYAI